MDRSRNPGNSAVNPLNMDSTKTDPQGASKRIWIDLDNSPHVPFFAPIIEELKKRGYSILLTARDAYQVCDLADRFRFNYRCVGRHWGKHWILKVFGTCLRAVQILPMVAREKPQQIGRAHV